MSEETLQYFYDARSSNSFDQHQQVSFIEDQATGLTAFIAIHNTNLGPAVGGCRMFNYADSNAALEDVLRLSRGMTYKSALAGLPMGGGKSVIIGNPESQKSEQLMLAMGRFINAHQGAYVSAEDSGMGVSDLKTISRETQHVLGIEDQQAFGGDPSPLTARGIFRSMQAAAQFKYGDTSLRGCQVAIQGVGSVGRYLSKLLIDSGAEVWAADTNSANLKAAIELGAQALDPAEIHKAAVDIFAPCAMGAVLNDATIPELNCSMIVGGANNQLAKSYHAKVLASRGVVYAPDFVVNAGGIIEIYRQFKNISEQESLFRIDAIADTLKTVLEQAEEQGLDTATTAENLAESIFLSSNGNESTAQVENVGCAA